MIAMDSGVARPACKHAAQCGALSLAWLAIALAMAPVFGGEGPALQVVDAWVAASDRIGADVPLLMTIRNEAKDADSLLRVDCPVANFAEKHTVDRGEGAPAMRTIKSIPIPAAGEITLKADAYHVMLLQTRQTLAEGEIFSCSVVFAKAGKLQTEVHVTRPR